MNPWLYLDQGFLYIYIMKNNKSNIISGMTVDGVSQTPKVENTQPIKRTKEVVKTAEDNVQTVSEGQYSL